VGGEEGFTDVKLIDGGVGSGALLIEDTSREEILPSPLTFIVTVLIDLFAIVLALSEEIDAWLVLIEPAILFR